MVYALMLDRVDRQVTAERQVVAVFLAAGAKDIKLPTYEAERRLFDDALVAVPSAVDHETEELLRVLGVR